jgi:hypothetical protein
MDHTDKKLVCIATFPDSVSANVARSVLDSEGVAACLDAEATNTMMPYLGPALGGIKLLVFQDQQAKALALLEAHNAHDFDEDVHAHEHDPEDVYDDDDHDAEDGHDEEGAAEDSPDQEARDGHIRRAWMAAVLGLLLFPPLLNFYSFYLLLRHQLLVDDPRYARNWRVNAALGVNLLAMAGSALFWFVILPSLGGPQY